MQAEAGSDEALQTDLGIRLLPEALHEGGGLLKSVLKVAPMELGLDGTQHHLILRGWSVLFLAVLFQPLALRLQVRQVVPGCLPCLHPGQLLVFGQPLEGGEVREVASPHERVDWGRVGPQW